MDEKYTLIIDSMKEYATEIHTQCDNLFLKIKRLKFSKGKYEKDPKGLYLTHSYITDLEAFKVGYTTLINFKRPQNSIFLDLDIDKKVYGDNPIIIKKLQQFETLYKEQESRVSTEFEKIISEVGVVNEIIPHYMHIYSDKINLDNHFAVLNRMNELKSRDTCRTHSIGDDPGALYYVLPIQYKDISEDTAACEFISCCVLAILQEHKNSLLKIVSKLDYTPIESENFPLVINPLVANEVLSDNSVEGITWAVRYLDTPIPFAVMKYGKENKEPESKSYNIIHELAIGMVLNTIRNITPNFMYIWGAFSCSPPLITGVNPDPLSKTKNTYNYQSLCSNTDPKSMEIIMLTEYVDAKYTFLSFLKDESIPNYSKHLIDLMLQIMCSITIAQTQFRFVHGDLHDGNILIKQLTSPVTLTYVISELDSSKPFTITLTNVSYIAIIIDYGFSTLTSEGVRLNPLQNVFFNDENPFSPMSDMSMAFETIWSSKHSLLLIDLTKTITTDYSGTMYQVTRNFYNISSTKPYNELYTPKPNLPIKCVKMPGFKDFTCMDLPLADIKYVIGPCSFHYFKYGSRNIYLFGEAHLPLERSVTIIDKKPDMTQSNTIMFAGLVHSLVTQNPTRTYDLMFESSYFLEKKGGKHVNFSNSPTFNSITTTFLPCIESDNRKDCPYKNLRTHYVDFRKSIEVDPNMSKPQHPFFNINIRRLLKSGKVLKQINSIKDVRSREALTQYANDFLADKLNDNEIKHIIIMDIYGIARLLREFDPTIEKGNIQSNTQFKGTSENIIYYAGATHINQMIYFFTKYMHLPEPSIINKPYIPPHCDSFIKLDVGDKSLDFV